MSDLKPCPFCGDSRICGVSVNGGCLNPRCECCGATTINSDDWNCRAFDEQSAREGFEWAAKYYQEIDKRNFFKEDEYIRKCIKERK